MPSSVGDLAALGKLFAEYRPRLLAMLERRMDKGLAVRLGPEDVLSEAFLEAHRKYAQFRAQKDISAYAWLYRITLDTLIEAWRQHSRSPRDLNRDLPFPEQSSMQLVQGLVHSETSPSQKLVRSELRRAIRQTVELLNEKDRLILWMRHQDGLSHQEIAAVLGIGENTAMKQYSRALKRFKDLWKRIYPSSSRESR